MVKLALADSAVFFVLLTDVVYLFAKVGSAPAKENVSVGLY
jgi:hypothetical protein